MIKKLLACFLSLSTALFVATPVFAYNPLCPRTLLSNIVSMGGNFDPSTKTLSFMVTDETADHVAFLLGLDLHPTIRWNAQEVITYLETHIRGVETAWTRSSEELVTIDLGKNDESRCHDDDPPWPSGTAGVMQSAWPKPTGFVNNIVLGGAVAGAITLAMCGLIFSKRRQMSPAIK